MGLSYVVFSISMMIQAGNAYERPEVVNRWLERTQEVTAITTDFQLDRSGLGDSHEVGTLDYRRPGQAFLMTETNVHPPVPNWDTLQPTAGNMSGWLWDNDEIVILDFRERSALRLKVPQQPIVERKSANWSTNFALQLSGRGVPRSLDSMYPFLPGCPNKQMMYFWRFDVISDSAHYTWVQAKATFEISPVREWTLVLRKEPVELVALVVKEELGDQSVVRFSNIDWNPGPWKKPSLVGWSVLSP